MEMEPTGVARRRQRSGESLRRGGGRRAKRGIERRSKLEWKRASERMLHLVSGCVEAKGDGRSRCGREVDHLP